MKEALGVVYPSPWKRIAAQALMIAVYLENGIRHLPDTLIPETTNEDFSQFDREGVQRFGRLSVRLHLNDPTYDQRLANL